MSKISELSDGGSLQSTDYLIAVRSGGNVKVQPNGTVTGTTGSFSGNVTFADNAKAIFGAGSDLQIYHDGSNSYVSDQGTGNLRLQGATTIQITDPGFTSYSAQFNPTGAATLYYNNAAKLATTATGIDVTGTVTADGLTVDGSNVVLQGATTSLDINPTTGQPNITIRSGNTFRGYIEGNASGGMTFGSGPAALTRQTIDSNGDISFYEDTGTTPKFFWDASAEALGLGTTSPSKTLHVVDTSSGNTTTPAMFQNTGGIGSAVELRLVPTPYPNDIGSTARWSAIRAINSDTGNATDLAFLTNDISQDPTERMRITSAGNVGIGTTSPVADSGYSSVTLDGNTGSQLFLRGAGTDRGLVWASTNFNIEAKSTTPMVFRTNSTERMRIDSSGDVLIGTTGAYGTNVLNVNGGIAIDGRNASTPGLCEKSDLDTGIWWPAADTIAVTNGGSESMRIDSAGLVGIGTTSPQSVASGYGALTIGGTSGGGINFNSTGSAFGQIYGNNTNVVMSAFSNRFIAFNTNGSERARIDSSGNLLVGTTTANPTGLSNNTPGVELSNTGGLRSSVDDDVSGTFNRKTNEGPLLLLRVDGDTKGIIGIAGSRPYLSNRINFSVKIDDFANGSFIPADEDGAASDNVSDIGTASARWDDIYATNSTIQTSDANEKQDIAELDEAERRVAVACKGLLRKFRWIDSVEAKGDEARIHFGIIAQDLQAAFEAEGLDAGRYAMFIHSTWTDEETGEERSRMGVRYSELLAFIIAAL